MSSLGRSSKSSKANKAATANKGKAASGAANPAVAPTGGGKGTGGSKGGEGGGGAAAARPRPSKMRPTKDPLTTVRPCHYFDCWIAYLSAFSGAIAPLYFVPAVMERPIFERGLVATCCATVVIWIVSNANDNSSIYDPYWALAPPVLALWFKSETGGLELTGEAWHPRQLMVLGLVWIWALRFHIMVPWEGWWKGLTHEDWRYHDIRVSFQRNELMYWMFSLTSLHLTPTLLVYFAFAPAAMVLTTPKFAQPDLCAYDAVGLVVVLGAILLEAWADESLRIFRAVHARSVPPTEGKICRKGPWRYSRHPNYFGECLFWLGFLFFSVAMAVDEVKESAMPTTNPLWLPAGPIVMYIFFRFASLPLMDKRSLARRPGYDAVMRTTPAMAPLSFGGGSNAKDKEE